MQFWSLTGSVPYSEARELQLKLIELRLEGQIPDTVLFLEHEPVITRGRGLQFTGTPRPRHMPMAAHTLPPGIAFEESERGGDLTFHGPGQLVIYPICKLDGVGFGPNHDIAGFLRKMELVLVDVFARFYGVQARAEEDATGVWVGDKKIASMGIAIRKWITYHGMAVNCVNDLRPFHLISPCGFNPEVMTRLEDWAKLDLSWRTTLEHELAEGMTSERPVKIESFSIPQILKRLQIASTAAAAVNSDLTTTAAAT